MQGKAVIYTGSLSQMRPHWGEGLADLREVPGGVNGTCVLYHRTKLLLPTNFLFYVGPWRLNGDLQHGIVRIPIVSGKALSVIGEPNLAEIHCKLEGHFLRFTSFERI